MTNRKAVVFLFLLSALIISVWFIFGKQLAGGEEGFRFFNNVSIISQMWPWQNTSLGLPWPLSLPGVVILLFVKACLNIGLPFWFTQYIIFILIFSAGMIGMYYLTQFFVGKINGAILISFLAASFYFLNLFTESQIIGRFVYQGMFAWSFLPVFLYFSLRWITEGGKRWLLFFALSSILFSPSYLNPVYVMVFFAGVFVWSIVEFVYNRSNFSKLRNNFFRTLLLVIVWLIINLWWIIPVKSYVNQSSLVSSYGYKFNLNLMDGLSTYFPNSEIFLLRQKFLFGPTGYFFEMYNNPLLNTINILVLFLAGIGLLSSKGIKYRKHLLAFSIVGWWISKGSNFPLGHLFYEQLFSFISFAQSLRNSYEKFGIFWIMTYAIFFALGVFWVYRKSGFNKKILFLVIFLTLGILVWPMWSGKVYPDYRHIKLPDYYQELNNFLNSDNSDFRVLDLPILYGDSIKYSWGYWGINLPEYIFEKPFISRSVGIDKYQERYIDLYDKFTKRENYNSLLDEMNVKYLVLHHDLDYSVTRASSSAEVVQTLNQNPMIKQISRIGELTVYEYLGKEAGQPFVADGENKPVIEYKKINPSYYRLSILGAVSPYNLVFKESFGNQWKAVIAGNDISEHSEVFGYANMWRINKKGNYSMDVYLDIWPWKFLKVY